MKKIKFFPFSSFPWEGWDGVLFTSLLALLGACSDSDVSPEPEPVIPAQRTIIAYFDGNNSLASNLTNDIEEIRTGSVNISANYNVIVFANINGKKPYIAEMAGGKKTVVREWDSTFFATNPDSILSIMQWIVGKYPANEYGIVFGGHGTGSIVSTDTIATTMRPAYAYGNDNSNTTASGKVWINTTTLATVISHLPRTRFIFFDCCLMQDIDVAGQLKKYTDYIIAPVCETPAEGAPYDKITPLFIIDDTEKMCDTLLTTYQTYCQEEPNSFPICISALRTYYVDDMQAKANIALQEVKQNLLTAPVSYVEHGKYNKVIYYYKQSNLEDPCLYDLKSFLYQQNQNNYLSDATYNAFVEAQKKCIFTSRKSKKWKTGVLTDLDFTLFDVEDYNYGALSITRETLDN